jgi:Fe-S-cluster containining protein
MENLLDNYHQVIARIDDLCRGIEAALHGQISCSEGCSSCCTAISLFPVEAAALRAALDNLPEQEASAIRSHVRSNAAGERCPLLSHDRCLLYAARPIICRTHGLPILYTDSAERRIDCCPRNLEGCESLSGSAVIDLDRLNVLLAAVNALFRSQAELPAELPERMTIAEAILGKSK